MPIDYSLYADDWQEISYSIRFERAGGRCECSGECEKHDERCEAQNYAPHPVTGSRVILTVAHLDHDINNNDLSNLMAMCQKCHLTYDASYHAKKAAATRRQQVIDNGQMELFGR
jgi:hypothetical protein